MLAMRNYATKKARKHCMKCGNSTQKADREVCKNCGSTDFFTARKHETCGPSEDPQPPLDSIPLRRPRRRSPEHTSHTYTGMQAASFGSSTSARKLEIRVRNWDAYM